MEEVKSKTPTVQELMKRFNTEKKALEFIISHFYPCGKIVCPHCGCSEIIYDNKRLFLSYNCGHCRNAISPFNGTMFELMESHCREWLYIIYSMLSSRKSVSGFQLARETHYTPDGIYKLRRRIQLAMANYDLEPFSGSIQIDEVFLGGSNHGRYNKSEEQKQLKYPVIGVYSNQGVYSYPIIPDENGECLSSKALKAFIDRTCEPGSVITTDEWRGYNFLDKEDSVYHHEKVRHNDAQYINENGFTTNVIEGYWGIIKKTYYSTHANFSKEWAHLYLAEADFRYNHRDVEEAMDIVLKQGVLFPQVIDIRNMGRYANRTYDLKKYKMILPKCFDDTNIEDITALDIVTCDEPVYGILREPYQSRKKQGCKDSVYPDEWKALGMVKGGSGYKDYRTKITNTIDDVADMLKDATKYKEVNVYNRVPNESKRTVNRAQERARHIRRKYKIMPPMVQYQIKQEYPYMFRVSNKEKTKEIHKRMNQLFRIYNSYNTNT